MFFLWFIVFLFLGWNCWKYIERGKIDEKVLLIVILVMVRKIKRKGEGIVNLLEKIMG